ncbi:MAG: PfaD family polyunsaturated fatty acid/polyketide biosynthesis protein [Acidobacteriota bacterium]
MPVPADSGPNSTVSTLQWPADATPLGRCHDAELLPAGVTELQERLRRLREPLSVVLHDGVPTLALGGSLHLGADAVASDEGLPLLAHLPAAPPERLGDPEFTRRHDLRFPYVAGAMANGIASTRLVAAMARERMLGFFGAAGLGPDRIEAAIDELQAEVGDRPHGYNLIHSPNEQDLEQAVTELYLRRDVRLIEASAYLDLTPHVVRFRLHGIHRGPDGEIVTPNQVVAKVSRVEVARRFLSPAPERLLTPLVEAGHLSREQAELSQHVPLAEDLTAEADSGGHTDNRPALALLPTLIALRDEIQEQHGYQAVPRVGAAGGVATGASASAVFALGAAYVLTGTINQACVESGSSDPVRAMLAQAEQADVAMAPAADMFEMGVKVQVLKRGTLFAPRAGKLYEIYRSCDGLDDIPAKERAQLEKTFFKQPLEEAWADTRAFFEQRDPRQVERAERDPKHRMALVFRSYLGRSSRWANAGDPGRRADYQVWCGPAMGAFNEWTKGSFLEEAAERKVAVVAKNLVHGAAFLQRVAALRAAGLGIHPEAARCRPMREDRLEEYLS